MEDPVDLESGITYERRAIEEWLESGKTTCPAKKCELLSTQLTLNYNLRELVQEWKEKNVKFKIENADGGKSKGAPARKSSRVAAKEGSKPREAKSSKPKEVKEKANKTRVVSEKKKAPSCPEPTHPTCFEMVVEAIATLKERSGSSRIAIAKYIEEHYKNELPTNFKKFLNNQLRNLSEKEQITQVRGSFKLTDELKKSSAVKAISKVADKQPSAETKPERAAVKAAAAPKPPKKLKVAKISQTSKSVKSSKAAKPAPKFPKPAEPAAKVADHEKPTPKAKPVVKAGRGRPAAGSKPTPYPAPPTPKPEKTAAKAKKGKPAPSKPAPASKSKSTPAKGFTWTKSLQFACAANDVRLRLVELSNTGDEEIFPLVY